MKKKIKKVKWRDIRGIFLFLIVFLPAWVVKISLKLRKKQLWLICETSQTARDNGYVFYKYLKKEHPEILSFYAIDKRSMETDYEKVRPYGNIIQWSSLKHYFYYLAATMNISSHKEGNPNHTLFTVLQVYLGLYHNKIFLQHGVLYQDFPMFHYKNAKFKLFITGAKREYDYVSQNYGYQRGEVKYTGLARFDQLHDSQIDKKMILLIPTWRRWLDTEEKVKESDYYQRLYQLINNQELENLLEKYDRYLYFYPHQAMKNYVHLYRTGNQRVKILGYKNVDIQKLLKEGALLITDFSSIATDFAYQYKPVIYYQYDQEEFYQKHEIGSTHFDFEQYGFGEVISEEEKLIKKIEYYIQKDSKIEERYIKNIDAFFVHHDQKNCQRIYEEIMGCERK